MANAAKWLRKASNVKFASVGGIQRVLELRVIYVRVWVKTNSYIGTAWSVIQVLENC